LFVKLIGCFESPHLFPTFFLIFCTFPSHHVPRLVALQIWVGFPTLEFLLTCCYEPIWLLSSSTKYTPQLLPKPKKHILLNDVIVK
jgi:hypothetical protein